MDQFLNISRQSPQDPSEPVVELTLRKNRTKERRQVIWTTDTVDNEHMNKKKSKCCCIYEKPHKFGESDDERDDDTEHCFGHTEKDHQHKHEHSASCTFDHGGGTSTETQEQPRSASPQRTAVIVLKPKSPPPPPPPADAPNPDDAQPQK